MANVSKACQIMGLSRDTFYRYLDAVEDGAANRGAAGAAAPGAQSQEPDRSRNRERGCRLCRRVSGHGQVRVSNELHKQGVFVSASGVRSIWMRHGLVNFKARLKALEAKIAEEDIILTEAQVQALEKWTCPDLVQRQKSRISFLALSLHVRFPQHSQRIPKWQVIATL